MAFQIVRIVPIYDDCDCVRGSRAFHLANAYETAALAHALAARMQEADEVEVRVVPYGKSAFGNSLPRPIPVGGDQIPF